ncbi:MAG: cell division protein FtsZ [Oscillospiraceae bacterium]|nr:cell division protein FtsZ [Oscillospiraceae bacterium]MBQ8378003.1 cell division protein FtsZ [Oscillospiraceae bacterium]MBQ8884012.1 cell division protein FtsZ [Oscillospiraceae bacterium]
MFQNVQMNNNGAKIIVVGVGGGGGNALNCIVAEGVKGNIDYIAVNTDVQALNRSQATQTIQIGPKLTQGLGAGGNPEVGEQSAQETKEDIAEALRDCNMVFITAGMGGGTGTGAAPVVAEIAKELGKLTVAVVTKPFAFEGKRKMEQAEKGIKKLLENVDSLIVIPNQKLMDNDAKITMRQAYAMADDVLKTGVKSIADLILRDGFINVDFADVTSIMKCAGYAHMAMGHGQGKEKAKDAAKQVITSPLLETSIKGARRLLLNVVMSDDVTTVDLAELTDLLTNEADPNANIITGVDYIEDGDDEIFVTVIASDFVDFDNGDAAVVEAEALANAGVKAPGNTDIYDNIFGILNS